MRKILLALSIAAVSASVAVTSAHSAKSKLGCEFGKEKWDASVGKCMPMAKKAVAKAAPKAAPKK